MIGAGYISSSEVLKQIASLDIDSPELREMARREIEERKRHYSDLRQRCTDRGMSEEEADSRVTGVRMLDHAMAPGVREHLAELNIELLDRVLI